MDWRAVAREAEGLHTADSFSRALSLRPSTAIFYLHRLRQAGFVRTQRGKRGKRLYDISPLQLRPVGSPGFLDIINAQSVCPVSAPCPARVYGRRLTLEEAIVEAIGTKDYRIIRAALSAFRSVHRWDLLYTAAKKAQQERQVGALYALARRLYRIRAMDGRFLRLFREAPLRENFLSPPLRSRDFTDIEKEWGVRLPFNKADVV